jgi:hypothetical protein
MSNIIQKSDAYLCPRGEIEFDEYERNAYVSRFLDVFNSDLTEQQMCEQAYGIHLELCTRHDLYIAVCDRLETRQRSALRIYAACKGIMK